VEFVRVAVISPETSAGLGDFRRETDRLHNKNYKVLKATADWLSGQKEPDIDQLVPKVETAMKAYSICKDRLDKVQATLGQYFQKDGAPDGAGAIGNGDGAARKSASPGTPNGEEEDDVPF
jgi:exodeoxyribonuclease VII small subunit